MSPLTLSVVMSQNPYEPTSERIPNSWMTIMFVSQAVTLFLLFIMVYSDNKQSIEKPCNQNGNYEKGIGHKRDTMRTQALHGLRGVASLIVGIFHLLAYSDSPINLSGQVAMPIFYVISGFVLEVSYGRSFACDPNRLRMLLRYITRRFARLYPTFFLFNVISIPNLLRYAEVNLFIIPTFLLMADWVPKHGPFEQPLLASWTISVMFFLYVAFPLLSCALGVMDKAQTGQPVVPFRVAAVVASLFYFTGGWIASFYNWQGALYNSGLFAIPSFFAGCCAGHEYVQELVSDAMDNRKFSNGGSKSACCLSDAFLLVICTVGLTPVFIPKLSLMASFAAQLPVYACVLALSRPCSKKGFIESWVLCSPAMHFMGEISMCFYLLVPVLQDYMFWVHGSDLVMCTLRVSVFVLAFPGAWALTNFFEKPLYHLLVNYMDTASDGNQKLSGTSVPYHLLN